MSFCDFFQSFEEEFGRKYTQAKFHKILLLWDFVTAIIAIISARLYHRNKIFIEYLIVIKNIETMSSRRYIYIYKTKINKLYVEIADNNER